MPTQKQTGSKRKQQRADRGNQKSSRSMRRQNGRRQGSTGGNQAQKYRQEQQ
jgi:hypothetical protein